MSVTDTPVRLPIPPLPRGFRMGAVHAGIKRNATREDVTLIASDQPATAAGVYTTNLVFAAPVALDRERTPGRGFRGVVINSGNANACTGSRGLDDAREMAALAGRELGVAGDEILVLSTGIIGEFMPMAKLAAGIKAAAAALGDDDTAALTAARGMMTTDTRPKMAGGIFTADGSTSTVFGMAKGAAMIGPKLATMLGVVITDAAIYPADAQRLLSEAVEETFNCVSVDGHMSTNDTVLFLANGAVGGGPLHGAGLEACGRVLHDGCDEPRCRPADRPNDRRQPPGQDSGAWGRSQLGADRLGRGLCGGGVRPFNGDASPQWRAPLPARRPGGLRRRRRLGLDQGQPGDADRTLRRRRSRQDPVPFQRPDGRVRPPQRRLLHLTSRTTGCFGPLRPKKARPRVSG